MAKQIKDKEGGSIMKTSSMGSIKRVFGKSADKIQAAMQNPNVNKTLVSRSAEIAASITVRKPKD